jgi:hypothetical protein
MKEYRAARQNSCDVGHRWAKVVRLAQAQSTGRKSGQSGAGEGWISARSTYPEVIRKTFPRALLKTQTFTMSELGVICYTEII